MITLPWRCQVSHLVDKTFRPQHRSHADRNKEAVVTAIKMLIEVSAYKINEALTIIKDKK